MKKILYVDADNTLFSFPDEEIKSLDDLYEPGLFLKQTPYTNVIDAIKILIKENNVYVRCLSAYPDGSKTAVLEKNQMFDRYIPEIPVAFRMFLPSSIKKCELVRPNENTWLLDDYSKNCIEWTAAGGNAVKLVHAKNGQGKKWKGERVYHEWSPNVIAERLKEIIG